MDNHLPIVGVTPAKIYQGQHRAQEMNKGVGYIHLGDRNRALFEYGVSVAEERDCLDRYSKWTDLSH